MRKFERVISKTQSVYKLIKEKKNITQQCSYNLPIELEEYLKKINAIKRLSQDGNKTHVLYALNDDFKVKLSNNIISIISDSYDTDNNKVIFTHTEEANGNTPKFQLKKTDFSKFGQDYKWFVELYTNNFEGANFVTLVDESNKIIIFDVEFTHSIFVNNEPYEEDFLHARFYGMNIKNKNTCLSEEYPHVCLGWGKMGDLTTLISREDLEKKYKEVYPNKNNRSRVAAVSMIKLFRFDMKINDIVIYFDGKNANIGKVTSEYYYDPSYEGDSSNYVSKRNVKWLKSVEYSKLDPEFRSRTTVSKSIYRLDIFKSYILDLINDIEYINDVYDEIPFDKDITEEELKMEFQEWLTSYDNPDYTGKEKYKDYVYSLCRILSKGNEIDCFEISSILELTLNNIDAIISQYDENEELKAFDKNRNHAGAGIASLKKFKKFLEFKTDEMNSDNSEEDEEQINNSYNVKTQFNFNCPNKEGQNLVVYGTPGCGKSYYVQHELLKDYEMEEGTFKHVVRTTFYQDYTNTDFVGQLMPHVIGEKVTYKFIPGPFTTALNIAINNPEYPVALVIEELNRGNAASIFGDIFQLLDRKDGTSVYEISNINIQQYLEEQNPQYKFDYIKFPSNFSIFATMNTSDQNVFTLDTAFKRRWKFEKLKNDFNGNHAYKGYYIPGMDMCWEDFCKTINSYMLTSDSSFNSEDKQLGVYFVDKEGLRVNREDVSTAKARKEFAYKIFEYLWNDVSKFEHDRWFNDCNSLDDVIDKYIDASNHEDDPNNDGRIVFAKDVFNR